MKTYNEIFAMLDRLRSGSDRPANLHAVERVSDLVSVGLTGDKRFCVFFLGEELFPRLPAVRRAHGFQQWVVKETGEKVEANRLCFGVESEYQALVATVAVEFARNLGEVANGVLENGFAATEPLIEIMLRQASLSREEALGLHGELLLVLNVLKRASQLGPGPAIRKDPTGFWRGWQLGKRDLELGSVVVEVKTTTRHERRHHFHGFSQLEPRDASETLFVASVCLDRSEDGLSTLALVDQLRVLVRSLAEQPDSSESSFLNRLAKYGSTGRKIALNRLDDVTQRLVMIPYERSLPFGFYNMADGNLGILRVADLDEQFPVMQREGFECVLLLPDDIQGSATNPTDFKGLMVSLASWLTGSE